jgi:MPBQ/MSBQ methyltransferase
LVLATWCQRETPPELTKVEKSQLQFLYDEWAHPYFISIQEYGRLVEACNPGAAVTLDDWTKQTIVSWRHSIWAGVYDPLPVFTRPKIWYKTLRDIICLERMQRAFKRKLMVYGMMRVVKIEDIYAVCANVQLLHIIQIYVFVGLINGSI